MKEPVKLYRVLTVFNTDATNKKIKKHLSDFYRKEKRS